MRIGLLTAVAVGLFMLAPISEAQRTNFAGTMRVDASFQDWGFRFSGKKTGAYVAKVKLLERNGRLVFCGAGYVTGGAERSDAAAALRSTKVLLGGKEILRNLSYFENVRRSASLPIASASCFFTRAKGSLPKEPELEIKVPFQALR